MLYTSVPYIEASDAELVRALRENCETSGVFQRGVGRGVIAKCSFDATGCCQG
jgi:hypothetical protein